MAEHSATNKYADALNRAWRTFQQGILIDALVSIGAGLTILMGDMEVTSATFWSAVAVLTLKSVLVSTASYLHRLKSDPVSDTV